MCPFCSPVHKFVYKYERRSRKQRTRHGLSCFSEQPSLSELPLLDAQKAVELAAVFETLANDTRLRALNVIAQGVEASPTEIAEKVGMKPQAISNQLKRLSDRGIIERRREGNQVYYRIVDPCVIDLLERGLWLTQDTKLRKETRRGRRTPQRELVENLSSDGSQFRDPSAADTRSSRNTGVAIRGKSNQQERETNHENESSCPYREAGLFAAWVLRHSQQMGPPKTCLRLSVDDPVTGAAHAEAIR